MSTLRDMLSKANGVVSPPPLDHDRIYPDYFAPRHRRWYELPESERAFTPAALEFNRRVHAGEFKQPRELRLSPSSIGTDCERELLFSYAGAPQIPSGPREQEVMDSGTHEHIRMQMTGLSAGWLTEAEIPVIDWEARIGGSVDGRGDDASIWEFKNTASHLYEPIAKGPDFLAAALERERLGNGSAAAYAGHMVRKHKLQMRSYKYVDYLLAKRGVRPEIFSEYGSLFYQDRATKKVYEIRIKVTEQFDVVEAILDSAMTWVNLDELPDMLSGCADVFAGRQPSDKERRRWASCHYRDVCPKLHTVTEAAKAG